LVTEPMVVCVGPSSYRTEFDRNFHL